MNSKNYVEIFKALGDETRVNVIKILSKENQCACQLLEAFQISQSTLSHHMKLLTDSGLVLARKEGKWVYYRINEEMFTDLKDFFEPVNAIDCECTKCGN
ncbi:MAG: metalloregulator ArsR/SmtB family transcription factor [Firmicutes bacterium]|nr:metalloregulator ArsR/SmtB family transcription factor [Bacillota bacterium]